MHEIPGDIVVKEERQLAENQEIQIKSEYGANVPFLILAT